MADTKRIRVDFSDGKPGMAPSNVSVDFPPGNHFDFFRILSEAEVKYVRWMKVLGAVLKAETPLKDDEEEYALAGLPENYVLLEQCKSQGEGKKHRTDLYLFGHPAGRFRSLNEFMPHLIWLALDKQHLPGTCPCKLCAGSVPRSHSRARPRTKQMITGMSEMGKAQMMKANNQMMADLEETAPCYRVGEVVIHDGRPFIVAEGTTTGSPKSVLDAVPRQTYVLFDLEGPHRRLNSVAASEIQPFLSASLPDDQSLAITQSASPIAKYTVSQPASAGPSLPGPSYVAWWLGPEKIYHKDLVRISPASDPGPQELMLLSHIFLDVHSNTVRVRGDIFELTSPGESSSAEVSQSHEREIPARLQIIAKQLKKDVKFVNNEGLEFDLALVDVHGRYYHPDHYSGTLRSVDTTEVVRGRVSSLPQELVKQMDDVFEASEEEDQTKATVGTRSEYARPQLIQLTATEPNPVAAPSTSTEPAAPSTSTEPAAQLESGSGQIIDNPVVEAGATEADKTASQATEEPKTDGQTTTPTAAPDADEPMQDAEQSTAAIPSRTEEPTPAAPTSAVPEDSATVASPAANHPVHAPTTIASPTPAGNPPYEPTLETEEDLGESTGMETEAADEVPDNRTVEGHQASPGVQTMASKRPAEEGLSGGPEKRPALQEENES